MPGKISCLLCLLGSTVTVLNAPKEEAVGSLSSLEAHVSSPGWLAYLALVLAASLVLALAVVPRASGSYLLAAQLAICSMVGSLSVMAVKGLGTAIKQVTCCKMWQFLWHVVMQHDVTCGMK